MKNIRASCKYLIEFWNSLQNNCTLQTRLCKVLFYNNNHAKDKWAVAIWLQFLFSSSIFLLSHCSPARALSDCALSSATPFSLHITRQCLLSHFLLSPASEVFTLFYESHLCSATFLSSKTSLSLSRFQCLTLLSSFPFSPQTLFPLVNGGEWMEIWWKIVQLIRWYCLDVGLLLVQMWREYSFK